MAHSFVDSARAAAAASGVPGVGGSDVEPAELDPELPPWLALGAAFERSIASAERSGRGAHFTPPWLAVATVKRVVDATSGPVIDPSCGGGAFLMAALDRLAECGVDPSDAMARVIGLDVDETSLAVVDVAARWWAHAHGAPWEGLELRNEDSLSQAPPCVEGRLAPTIVGNPPFFDQLDRRSARDEKRRTALNHRFGDIVGPYTDDAALFLAWAVESAGARGRVGMVLPRSMLAARDGEGVRRWIADRTSMRMIWFDHADTFDAGVRVCVLHVDASDRRAEVEVCAGDPMTTVARVAMPDASTWAPLLAAAELIPVVTLPAEQVLGSHADVIAGFRDEYYGLRGAVRPYTNDGATSHPRLVTAGSIDLAELHWATKPVRFAKQRWNRPVVDIDAIEDERVRVWVSRLLHPKVLVATQTRAVECVVDEAGAWIGSVPVLNVIPRDPDEVWMLAAALAAPPVTAWAFARRAGAALSANAIKLSAADIRAAPLPVDLDLWAIGADQFRVAQSADSVDTRRRALDRFGATMTEAYGCDARVFEWWQERRG